MDDKSKAPQAKVPDNPPARTVTEQAFLNIEAKAKKWGLWTEDITPVRMEADRLYFSADHKWPALLETLRHLHFFQEGRASSAHEGIRRVFLLGDDQELVTYREIARPSLQITFTTHEDAVYGDMDIDLSSPLMDVWGALVHLVEVLTPGKTDHRKVAKILRKQGYDV